MTRSGNTQGTDRPRPTPIYRDWTVLQLAALVFLLDQFTKYLVTQLLPFRSSFPAEGLFRFTHTHNTGSAFGIFQGQNTPLIFISFVGIIILVLIYRSQPRPSNWLRLSLGLQLGGAFGNLVDRLRLGYVTDFIDIGLWPVFNLADASIVTGLVLLAWVFLGPRRHEEPGTAGNASENRSLQDGYQWCPVCDGDMKGVPGGWRCLDCGVKERIESRVSDVRWKGPLPVPIPLTPPDGHLTQELNSDHAGAASEEPGAGQRAADRRVHWPEESSRPRTDNDN